MAKVVLSLVGKQGSGKTTLGKKLARNLGTRHIETSDVVKSLHTDKERHELPETGKRTRDEPDWLAAPLYDEIYPVFNEGKQTVVLTGVREVEVHSYLQRRGLYLLVIDVLTEPSVRYTRLRRLEKVKNVHEFLDQELGERALGIDEVADSARIELKTSEQSKPDAIVRKLISHITSEGTRVR